MPEPGRQTESRYYSTIAIWAVVCILIGVILYFLTRPSPPPEPPQPTVTVTATATATATVPPPTDTPVEMIRKYYSLIDQDRFDEAFQMRSSRSHQETPFDHFHKTWANNESIEVQDVRLRSDDGDRAVVIVRLLATDQGHPAVLYQNTVNLVKEGGEWRYAGADVKALPR